MNSPNARVSVIMRSMNSAWSIEEALAGLFSQDFKDFDLLLVDSDSKDGTIEIARKYPCRIINVQARAYYPGEVLNHAIEQTSGDIIVFHNSDAIPLSPKAYTHLLGGFSDPKVQAAYARQLPRPEASAWVRHDYAVSFPEEGPAPPWMTLSLPLAAMRRSIWCERPFYTEAYSSEDTEWGHWALSNGHAIKYVPEALVMHSHNYTLRQMYGRRFVEGEGDVFIYGGGDSLVKMAGRIVTASLSDTAWSLRHGQYGELAMNPIRRAVYHWAYYRGHKLGERRKATGDHNRNQAQEVVKSRHVKLG
jgi:rhamnosyltransferase